MKRDILPDYQKKQRLLYAEQRSERELIDYGEGFLKEGKLSDAIEFYQKAQYRAGLEAIKEKAKQMGDVMALLQAGRALNQPLSEDDWRLTGNRARELKKYRFALYAYEKSGNEDLLQEVREISKAEGNEVHK